MKTMAGIMEVLANHKNVVCTGNMTTRLKKLHQVMKLAMNITTYSNRAVHWLYIGLFNQNLFHLPKQTNKQTKASMLLLQVCIEYRPNKQQKQVGIKTLITVHPPIWISAKGLKSAR